MRFFAYGSLRPGGSLHHLIERDVSEHWPGYIEGRLFLLPIGYPILVEGDRSYPVTGDVLEMPDSPIVLRRLDEIEATAVPDSPYLRVQRLVGSDRGDTMAWVYVCKDTELATVMSVSSELEDGDWFAHRSPG